MAKLRIISGKYRSRILEFSTSVKDLRPTPDRVRETLFNWLGQDLSNKTCLDLFAGSGALSFEALSRNAQAVTLVEHDSIAIKFLQKNWQVLRFTDVAATANSVGSNDNCTSSDDSCNSKQRCTIIQQDVLIYLAQTQDTFDVIFIDAPYQSDLLGKSLEYIMQRNLLQIDGCIYIEYRVKPNLENYTVIKHAKAGNVNYALLQIVYN